jgi:membrane protein
MQAFFNTRILPRRWVQLLIKTGLRFHRDRCLEMGAALSYYAFFSLFPILLTAVSIIGFLLGPDSDASAQILSLSQSSLPPKAFQVIRNTLQQLNQNSVQAGLYGIILMLFSASTIFGCLDRSVDFIWRSEEEAYKESKGIHRTIAALVRKKMISFAVVIFTTVLIFFSMLFRVAVRSAVRASSDILQNVPLWEQLDLPLVALLNRGGQAVFLFLAIYLLLYYLPSTDIHLLDIWPGALLATFLITTLHGLMSTNIVRIGAQFQSYGAIGGVMVLLLWIYLSSQILLLSCELTYVYAHLYGSRRRMELKW